MSYDRVVAQRLRDYLFEEPDCREQPMFGGLAFLLDDRLAVAASSDGGLLLRVDPADTDELVGNPGVDRMVMRGREMDGWLRVGREAISTDDELRSWVDRGLRFVRTL